MDSIPKQQFGEMRELAQLTGSEVSVHGPVIDTTGMTQQGYSELNRELSERKITQTLLKSHEINPNGNIPVTFHSAEGILSSEWKTLGDVEGKNQRQAKRMIAVDKESGRMIPLDYEQKYYPKDSLIPGSENEGTKYTPEQNLQIANTSTWDEKISQLFINKERADEILEQNRPLIQPLLAELSERQKRGEDLYSGLTDTQKMVLRRYQDAENYLGEITKQANGIFSKGYQYGTEEQKKDFRNIAEVYKRRLKEGGADPFHQSMAVQELLSNMQNPALAPEMFVPIEKWALDKSSTTFSNAAFNAFKTFKKDPNKTPMLVIENPPAGFGLSTGEDLKNLVIETREKFVKKAVENGISEGQAQDAAEKLIGATWDVGHINMLRRFGFGDKDIVKETEKVAPYVKHVHLSDNFGYEHTELPMGMGNVPMKEIMAKLGEEGFEGKKVIEASTWWQHFQTAPVRETLEGLGSPMYMSGKGPYWNQSGGFEQGYLSGFGMMLPQNSYQTFGAGFSQLPAELGGNKQNQRME